VKIIPLIVYDVGMYHDHFITHKMDKVERRIRELELEHEGLKRKREELLHDLKLTEKQLLLFLANPDHFSKEEWVQLQKTRKKIEAKLEGDLTKIKSKTQKLPAVGSHWLHVR